MLEYAASRRKVASRPSSPNAMLLIISAHVALLAVVMSAKMDLPRKLIYDSPTRIDLVPDPSPPRPQPIKTSSPQPQPIENPQPQVPTASTVQPTIEATPSIDFGKILGPSTSPPPEPQPTPLAPEGSAYRRSACGIGLRVPLTSMVPGVAPCLASDHSVA